MATITVREALATLRMDGELRDYLISKREEWAVFGKMNSHLYRAMLMKQFREANLNGEQCFMVHFLFSVIKNKDRVLKAVEAMSAEDKARSWFAPVMQFINTRITQYVSDVQKSKKFPAVNIPNCNPGIDILVYALITHPNDRSIRNAAERTTFSQLFLDAELQAIAKEGYAHYWDNVVKSSKNPDSVPQKLPEPAFREDYYANSVNDDYRLVDVNLHEVEPSDRTRGYSVEDVVEYFRSIDPLNEFVVADSVLSQEVGLETEGGIVI